MEQEHSLLAAMVENADLVAVFKDCELRYKAVNKAYLQLIGLEHAEQALGKTDLELFQGRSSPEQISAYMENDRRALAHPSGQVLTMEETTHGPDGAVRTFLSKKFPVYSKDGECLGVATLSTEITDRKHMEEDLRVARDAAEAASQAKSEFLANISHELRTPLNGILGILSLLEATNLDEEQEQWVSLAGTSARNLTRVINDILDLTRIEAGFIAFEEVPFDLRELLDTVRTTFTDPALSKGLELSVDLDPRLPRTLLGDPSRIRLMLVNLVGNALKFTSKGRIQVAVSRLPDRVHDPNRIQDPDRIKDRDAPSEEVQVIFTVQDTGVGIPDDKLDMIFGAFTQADGSHTRKFEGSGLGLPIVKRLVERMHGSLTVNSEPGAGTEIAVAMRLRLPSRTEGEAKGQDKASTKSILVAEQDTVNRLVLERFLENLGYQATGVKNGAEALDLLTVRPFDLVFLDIRLPDMDTAKAITTIRSDPALVGNAYVPLVALAEQTRPGAEETPLPEGMTHRLCLPVDKDDLTRLLAKLFPTT